MLVAAIETFVVKVDHPLTGSNSQIVAVVPTVVGTAVVGVVNGTLPPNHRCLLLTVTLLPSSLNEGI